MMINVTSAVKGLSAINDELAKLGLLEKVRNKLINNPDKAAQYLENALHEIKQDIEIIDNELVALLSLRFETEEERRVAEDYFIKQRSDKMMDRVEQNRGHCSKIYNTYLVFLRGWFSRVLDKDENDQIVELFSKLRGLDKLVVDLMKEIASWLPSLEAKLMRLMQQNNFKEATREIQLLRDKFIEPRKRLYELSSILSKLHADFIDIGRIVS